MPYARPGAAKPQQPASALGSSIATPWSSEQLDRQLAAIGSVHGGSSTASSLSLLNSLTGSSSGGSGSSLPSTVPTSPSPSLSRSPASWSWTSPFEKQQEEHAKMPITAVSHAVAGVAPAVSSRKAMKAALFQISDGEDAESDDDEEELEEAVIDEEEDERRRYRSQYGHKGRSDPVRSSISAMSGVTVIGRGSFSSLKNQHNRAGSSVSSRGSMDRARTSIDEEKPVPSESMPAPDPPFAPKTDSGQGMNLNAALNLLNSYPRSTSPARNRPESEEIARAKPPLPRTVSAYAGQASSLPVHDDAATSPTSRRSGSPGTAKGATAPPRLRRHSRSSIHERGDLFPLSPVSATSALPSASQPFVSPTLSNPAANDYMESSSSVSATARYRNNPAGSPPGTMSARRSPSHSISSQHAPEPSTSERSEHVEEAGSQSMSRRSSRASERRAEGSSASTSRRHSASRSVLNADLGSISRSFSQRPRRSLSRHQIHDDIPSTVGMDGTNNSYGGTMTEEPSNLRRSMRSRDGSQADLKALIQQKRRQASAPFSSQAKASVPPSASASPVLRSGAQSPLLELPKEENSQPAYKAAWDHTPPRRIRSRHATTAGVNGLAALSMASLGNGFEEARLRAMRGMGEVVMTPSVEEWRQLGLTESLNDRDDDGSSSGSGSGSDDDSDESFRGKRKGYNQSDTEDTKDEASGNGTDATSRIQRISAYGRSPSARDITASGFGSSFSKASHGGSRAGKTSSPSTAKSPRLHDNDVSSEYGDGETDGSLDLEADMERRLSQRDSGIVPTLSRNSLSAATGATNLSTSAGHAAGDVSTSGAHASTPMGDQAMLANGTYVNTSSLPFGNSPNLPFSPSRASSPIPLALAGPIDSRAYSAVTGMRTVNSFIVQGEAGKGAYGLVRKVRERGADGQATGPPLMLKYIVKQRILADAYKRHKVLGAIPMEIHVLDFIRRVQRSSLLPRDPLTAVSAFKSAFGGGGQSKPSLKELHAPNTASEAAQLTSFGHPALCQMLDFFEDAENYYLVMSCFGDGQDLFDYVDAAPNGLGLDEARSILRQIVDAVAFLHSHGIVHRDIKDENIILDGKGGVQLIDFGSAAYIKEGKPYFDTFSGTLDFASPEVLRGERYGGKETDIWALGVLAYVIICGECPFWSSEESLMGLAAGSRADEALLSRMDDAELAIPDPIARDTFAAHANDAIDFVHQCLDVHARDRPSALHLRTHRFLVDREENGPELGWIGNRGWEAQPLAPEEHGAEGQA